MTCGDDTHGEEKVRTYPTISTGPIHGIGRLRKGFGHGLTGTHPAPTFSLTTNARDERDFLP